MTPLASWALFLVCVAIGVVVYVVVAGGRRYRRMEVDFLVSTVAPIDRFRPELDAPYVRVLPSVYDHEARGDFEHDPIRDHEWCDGCNALLRRALNRLGDLDLGPRDVDTLMAAIRQELES